MTEEKIQRINELYHKSKTVGLSESELVEQSELRREYIEAIKTDMRRTLNNCSVVNPDGSITELKSKHK